MENSLKDYIIQTYCNVLRITTLQPTYTICLAIVNGHIGEWR